MKGAVNPPISKSEASDSQLSNRISGLGVFVFFLIQFNVPFKIISAYMRRANQYVGGAKTGEPREKPPDTPASRTWLVSHVARAGLEPTPDTAVR